MVIAFEAENIYFFTIWLQKSRVQEQSIKHNRKLVISFLILWWLLKEPVFLLRDLPSGKSPNCSLLVDYSGFCPSQPCALLGLLLGFFIPLSIE